jgi:salicylate hydroxylase
MNGRVDATPDPGSIAIIGAGLGGLAAALALMWDGWRVRVYEQAPALGEVGAGITVSPGAGRVLEALGVGPQVLAASLPIPDIAFVHYRTGALLAGRFNSGAPLDQGFDGPRHIHRADLHAILLAAVRAFDPEAVLCGKTLVDLTQSASGVEARFADGSRAEADLLIGADGARSGVRACILDDSPPQFAGQIAFRCLVPREQAQPFMAGGNAVVSIGGSRVFNRYLIRRGALVNVIGIAKSERWSEEGWNIRATVDEFRHAFEGFHGDVTGLIEQAPPDHLVEWGLFVRPPIAQWSVGRVILLGDAAHPILPFLGLGAALAIEDGVVLARALKATSDHAAAFAAFQAVRAPRVETVRLRTIEQGEIIQADEPHAQSVGGSPSQNTRIFDYDPTTVALHV